MSEVSLEKYLSTVWGFVPSTQGEQQVPEVLDIDDEKDALLVMDSIPMSQWRYLLTGGKLIDIITYGITPDSNTATRVLAAATKEWGVDKDRKIVGTTKVGVYLESIDIGSFYE